MKFVNYLSGPRLNSLELNLGGAGESFGYQLRENRAFGCSSSLDLTRGSIGPKR